MCEKYELLFGPVDINEFLDLSCSKTYNVTICSDKLLESRSNLFFLSLRPRLTNQHQPQNGDSFSSKLNANTFMNGLNVSVILQIIQITIRKYRRTGLPNEHLERSMMLMKSSFFTNLVEYTTQPSLVNTSITQQQQQSSLLNALDIMNWIVYNHFSMTDNKILHNLIEIFKLNLRKILIRFYLHGNRSMARKVTLFINFLLNKNIDQEKSFASFVLDKLIELLDVCGSFESSASLNWYFQLLHRCMSLDVKRCYEHCLRILCSFSRGHKYDPLYALLKMRYNFECLVFEANLFDVDLYFKFNVANQKLFTQSSTHLLNVQQQHQQQQQHQLQLQQLQLQQLQLQQQLNLNNLNIFNVLSLF